VEKKAFSSRIEEGKFLILTSQQLEPFMLENNFSDETKNLVESIRQKFDSASVILFFLNNRNGRYTLDCFLPIYNDKASFEGFMPVRDVGGVMCLLPFMQRKSIENWNRSEIELIARNAFRSAHWAKVYGFGVQEDDGLIVTQIDIEPYAKEPVSQGALDFCMEQLNHYREKAAKQPEFKPFLHKLVKDIEVMRRERDFATGFRDLQIEAHDYALRLPDVSDGSFDARCFDQFFDFIVKFFESRYKSLTNKFSVSLTPAHGSAMLLIDLIPENNLDSEMNDRWKESKEHLAKTVQAMPILAQKGDPKERVNKFCTDASLEPEKADKVLGAAKKLFPAKNKSGVEIYSKIMQNPLATFDHEGFDYFNKAKQDLSDSIKRVEDMIVSGYIGIMIGWKDNDMKFTILTDEGRRLTIKYGADQIDEVKSRFKKNVKLERIKDGRGWRLVQWK